MASAPELFGFAHDDTPAHLCRLISGGVLASTLATRAEWGLLNAMPYKTHLALDFAAGLGAMVMPWLAGFARNRPARNTFLVMGAISAGAALLSGVFGASEEMPVSGTAAQQGARISTLTAS